MVLVGFMPLDAEYDRLHQANQLREFTTSAIPVVQATLRTALGDPWCQPRLAPASAVVVCNMTPALVAPL